MTDSRMYYSRVEPETLTLTPLDVEPMHNWEEAKNTGVRLAYEHVAVIMHYADGAPRGSYCHLASMDKAGMTCGQVDAIVAQMRKETRKTKTPELR